ncbi:hypothetical protein, conserved [Entamoeba histolytica]
MEKHDNIGIIIWEGLIRKYTGNKQYKKPPYETMFQYKDITMICNKQIMPKKKLKDVRIIPVVISINGLINKESNKLIKELKIEIDIEKETKNLVIKNMNDVMEYCGDHNQTYSVELLEEEDEGMGLVSPEPGRIEASSINT